MTDENLDGAYALNGTEDTKRLYAEWAKTYDTEFVRDMDFLAPEHIAEAYSKAGGQGPVLDFGAGTGAVGQELAHLGIGPIHGVDLTPEMLDVARDKNVYDALYAGNVLDGFDLKPIYNGVVSSGTFTHGHVGPEALTPLIGVARPGAIFALTVKVEHYQAAGFADTLAGFGAGVSDIATPEVKIYGSRNTGPHKDDTCYILQFRKA